MLVSLTSPTAHSAEKSTQGQIMPIVSQFYGIVIRMLYQPTHRAHFHAYYQGQKVVVSLAPIQIVYGDAPARARAMVLEWAARHQRDLVNAWHRSAKRQPPLAIPPLT